MKVYPEDIQRAVAESKIKAEESKKLVQPPLPNPSTIDPQWQAVRRGQQ